MGTRGGHNRGKDGAILSLHNRNCSQESPPSNTRNPWMVSGQAGAGRASEKSYAQELVLGRSVCAEHLAQLRTLPVAEMNPFCAPESERERASEQSEREREREREISALMPYRA